MCRDEAGKQATRLNISNVWDPENPLIVEFYVLQNFWSTGKKNYEKFGREKKQAGGFSASPGPEFAKRSTTLVLFF